jgi:hypothetical protein
MPLKNKDKYNEYMKNYRRSKRLGLSLNDNSNQLEDNQYKNGKIYMIKCNITNNIYIGSTTQTLINRLNGHKQNNCSSYLILKK